MPKKAKASCEGHAKPFIQREKRIAPPARLAGGPAARDRGKRVNHRFLNFTP